jgi:DNA mismatch repair ATPase MutS
VLRALSVSALLAHTYGCSIGHLTATPFERIFVCLKPDDLPGSKSRFEREIEFTAQTLSPNEPTLVFIDELYHSTNPPDALRSCEIYCKQLWEKPNVVSVISTHLFELVEQAPEAIQRLCCPAVIDSTGIIHFSYQLQNGICKVSSVDTLLHKNGLMRA